MTDANSTLATNSSPARRLLGITLGLLIAAAGTAAPAAAEFGVADFDGEVTANAAGDPYTQAGGHPFAASTTFQLNQTADSGGFPTADGSLKDVTVALPAGLVGDPTATPTRCTAAELEAGGVYFDPAACPPSSQVGVATLDFQFLGPQQVPVYNMVTPPDRPAEFGFKAVTAVVHLTPTLRTGSDYGLTINVSNVSQAIPIFGTSLTFWGVPADPAHDGMRGSCLLNSGPSGDLCPTDAPRKPFLTLPTACTPDGVGLETKLHVTSWQGDQDDSTFFSHLPPSYPAPPGSRGPQQGPTGCDALPFEPAVTVNPESNAADTPTGVDVDVTIPQDGLTNPDGIAAAHLKRAEIRLPEGMAVSPAAASGLGACAPGQVELDSADDPTCPNSSKIGSVRIDTPLLEDPMEGSVYLAKQNDNPFGSLLAMYLVAKGPGLIIKLPGKVDPDPDTGQLTATFDDNPQLPFSSLQLHFKGGQRAPLVTPPTCGIYTVESEMVPWSAADPNNPTPDEVVTHTSQFTVDSAPNGGPCVAGDPNQPGDPADRADLPFAPKLSAGTQHPIAGTHSPFVMRLTRQDGEQEITGLNTDLPPGLTGKLAGIPQCSDAAINGIATAPGTGAAELASPSCPAASKVGYTQVGAGAGSSPIYVPGSVYLAGPYGGAPLSLAIVTPAVTGPFDLGNVVIRTKLFVDEDDAQLHAASDPIPTILQGIPLKIRDIRVVMDKPGFTLNPTNCNAMSVTGSVGSAGQNLTAPADDGTASVSDRFQASGCGGLGFSPQLSGQILNGKDGIHRSEHPNLLFSLKGTPGDANLSRVEVLLPQNFQIDQANLGNICSETQLATQDCAGRQRIGTASATTPLLDTPLSGPVYAVSGSGGLPKLAVILYGPPSMPIKLVVRGITETVGARIKNTFPLVPDAPVSDFALNLDGGPQGYLVNNSDLCGSSSKGKKSKKKGKGKPSIASAAKRKKGKKKSRSSATGIAADASFFGQNGDTLSQSVPISAECGAGGGSGKKGKSGKKRKGKRG